MDYPWEDVPYQIWSPKVKCSKHQSRDLECYAFHYPLRKMFPIEFGIKMTKFISALDIEVKIRFPCSRLLSFPLWDTISRIWTTHGWNHFLFEFGVQRSNALEIKVQCSNMFPGSRTLPFPPRVTISHVSTIHGTKISITFEIRRSKTKHFHLKVFHQALSLSCQERGDLYKE
jgi:hypothetical protein